MAHTDVRYLESKRTVDRRARSRRVRDRLLAALPPSPDIVDIGAGSGVMLRTLLEWGVREGTYRGIDRSEPLIAWGREHLPEELADDFRVRGAGDGFVVEGLSARLVAGDVLALPEGRADLVVAQALLDLVSLEPAMDAIEGRLRAGGLAYLPITFDGVTVFLPSHLDDGAVVDAYHAAIDDEPGRDSRAGRHLIEHLEGRGGELLAVGASDWVVRPHDGTYPADEAYFLECVLGFVENALSTRDVDAPDWVTTRRRQLDGGRLTYVAHGFDLLYRAPL